MKKIILLSALALALTITGCKKETTDICDNVTCLNNGTCINGTCDCPAGWAGANCETQVVVNPCAGITCLNGGTCANGLCNCPQNYTGSNCSQQKTPTHIYITKVDVLKFSLVNQSNVSWDVSSTADIYPAIQLNGNYIYQETSYQSNANNATTYSFTPNTPLDITDVTNSNYQIELWDDDGIGDDYMAGFKFTPYSNTNGFPSSVLMGNASLPYYNQFEFRVYYSYVW